MRTLLLFSTLFIFSGIAVAQNGEADGIRARERSDMERMRGEKVYIEDNTPKPGRDIDLVKLKKQNDEMIVLVRSVNADLVNLQRGVRSADLPKKLKQLEKLAKELRRSVE
ncbi:MAG TPA: hypothetical protein VF135_03410 [Terriglobales bacterium]